MIAKNFASNPDSYTTETAIETAEIVLEGLFK